MNHKKTLFLFILIFLASYALLPAQGNLGQSGANFLQIGVEPRGTGLGGAGVAVTEGAAALYWNPAGANSTENFDIIFAYTNWFVDTKLAFGAITKKFQNIGTIGLSITSFYMEDMEITSVYASNGTGQFYSAGDIAVGLSYARALTDRFTFGLTGKYVREDIYDMSADQIALDIGSLYRTDFYHLRLGIAIRNLAGKVRFSGESIDSRIDFETGQNIPDNPRIERLSPDFRLPQTFQLGIAFDPIHTENWRLTALTDVETPNDNQERIIFGLEYGFREFAYLRGAYRFNYDIGEISLGAGAKIGLPGFKTLLDYAFSTFDYLGDVHRFSIGFSF